MFSLNALFTQNINELLKKSGLSRSQAQSLIKKENVSANTSSTTNFNRSNEDVLKDVNNSMETLSFTSDLQGNDINEEVNLWDPPIVKFGANKNTTYTYDDTTYVWNGRGWFAQDPKSLELKDVNNEEASIFYFGYNTFNDEYQSFQKFQDFSIDPNYVIGPGDEVVIMLWGQTEVNKSYIISKEGYIFVENLGQVFVNGLTLKKLENKLFKLLSKVYSSLNNKNNDASTFFDVSLGSTLLKPIRAFVSGNLINPGAYNFSPNTTLFSSLFHFGGPSIEGSLRDIHLIRNGKKIASIDFYDFLLSGEMRNDIKIQNNDVIHIPARGKSVNVKGEISRPAIYELSSENGILDLIEMAGGLLSTTAYDRVKVERIINPKNKNYNDLGRKIIDINLNEIFNSNNDFSLNDGDDIQFFKVPVDYKNFVRVEGSVKRRGNYSLTQGMRVIDLIEQAGGLKGDAFLKKAYITRQNTDLTNSLLDVDLSQVLKNDSLANIVLQNKDVLMVYNTTLLTYRDGVSISGHVINPGIKSFRNNMTLYDLIFEAGGFENKMHIKKTFLERAELFRLKEDGISYDLIYFNLEEVLNGFGLANEFLKMGDKVNIYSNEDVLGRQKENSNCIGVCKKSR